MSYIYSNPSNCIRVCLGGGQHLGASHGLSERYVPEDDGDDDAPLKPKAARAPRPMPTTANPKLGEPPAAPSRCTLDATALAIIAAAQDARVPIETRARETVRSIIGTYYPNEATKVSGVQFAESVRGLETQSEGAGASARGLIRIGRDFVDGTNDRFFARRVLQVGHELRHIDQWRAGIVGPARSPEREFLAHCWTALAREKPGTGCMPHAMRVAIIDAALGNLYCLTPAQRASHAPKEATLIALRTREVQASGRAATAAPSACARSH